MDRIILVIILGLLMMGCCSKPTKAPTQLVANAIIPYGDYAGDYTNNPEADSAKHKLLPITLGAMDIADRTEVIKGLAAWNKVLNGYYVFIVVDDTIQWSTKVVHIEAGEIADDNILANTDRMCGDTITMDFVKMHKLNQNIETVAQHEIGHSLCMAHLQLSNTMMNPGTDSQPVCIDITAARQLATIYASMEMEHLNWCKL